MHLFIYFDDQIVKLANSKLRYPQWNMDVYKYVMKIKMNLLLIFTTIVTIVKSGTSRS